MTNRSRTSGLRAIAALVLAFAGSAVAQAGVVVLDFGDGGLLQTPTFDPPYFEDGFRFTTINHGSGQDHFDIADMSFAPLTFLSSGEREALVHTGNDGDEVIIDLFGAAFSLTSIDIEFISNPTVGAWQALASNGATFTFTGTGTINFGAGFANITSLKLFSTSTYNVSDFSGNLAFDNVTLETNPSAVPLPAGAAMGATGLVLAAIVAMSRRRRALDPIDGA